MRLVHSVGIVVAELLHDRADLIVLSFENRIPNDFL
jgi:hypothetical protein